MLCRAEAGWRLPGGGRRQNPGPHCTPVCLPQEAKVIGDEFLQLEK